jgi:hypothetical protein
MKLKTEFIWTVKERDPKTGLFVPVLRKKNVQTEYGLTAYAGAFQGNYTPPVYMVIDDFKPTYATGSSGTTLKLATTTQPTFSGDSQIVLSIGTANEEIVTFTGSPTYSSGVYTYTLTASPVNSHSVGDICVRNPLDTDNMSDIFSEVQYDSTNAPNARMQSIGGYSGGTANWVMQFFFTSAQAQVYFATVGLADNVTVGQPNLHNLLALGLDHTGNTNDLELDVSLTLSNV